MLFVNLLDKVADYDKNVNICPLDAEDFHSKSVTSKTFLYSPAEMRATL